MSHITEEQRYTISVMLKQGFKQIEIARAIGKDKSVVSREIRRNKGKHRYTFTYAQMLANERKERFHQCRKFTYEVEKFICSKLSEQWSPEQIKGYCYMHDIQMVSIERIYQYIRADKANGGTLYKMCRHRLKHRKKPVGSSVPIKDRISIEKRPPEADGTRFGDWEMDTIVDPWHHVILTLVERSTNYLLMAKLPHGKNAEECAKMVYKLLLGLTVKTITTDNGTEFAAHKMIAKKLKTTVYFAHPYSSWEKGAIENANGLIRQYISKKSNFTNFTDEQIVDIQKIINKRPRKKLDYNSPVELFYICQNKKLHL